MSTYTFNQLRTRDIDILDQMKFNSDSGLDGYIVVKEGTPVWTPRVNTLETYNPNIYDVNTGDLFMLNGIEIYNNGDPGFKYDPATGLFFCGKDGVYIFTISAVLDTYDGQTKFYMDNGSTKYGFAPSIYIPGNVNLQFYQFVVYMPCLNGETWTLFFFKWGVGNALLTVPFDLDFSNPQCTVSIQRL